MITLWKAVSGIPVLLALSSLGAVSQVNPAATTPELLIDQLKRTVVFLQGDFPCHEPRIVNGVPATTPEGTQIFESMCSQVGTGFLIIVQTPDLGPGMGVPMLVTSKHLIRHQALGSPQGVEEYFDRLTATINSLKPNIDGSYISGIPIGVKDHGFLLCSIDNEDPDADLAVCPIGVSDTEYDFKGLSPDICITKANLQSLGINETDEVLFSGLFLPFHGAQKNYPIVRHGRLALIPKEKIPWSVPPDRTTMQDLYLAEITSWGGNSGSPVFVRLTGAREQGGLMTGVQYFLLGIMQGYFNADRNASLDTAAITTTAHLNVRLSDNSGIAAIVPAEKIIAVLGQPKIKSYVSLVKAMSYQKTGKLPEAEASFKNGIDLLRQNAPDNPLLKEALNRYADFLQQAGRFPEANFQRNLANRANAVSRVPDDQLK